MNDLQEMGVPGFITMKIRAPDTDENQRVFSAFQGLAKAECRNDYTITLRKLLEYYEEDAKFSQQWYVIKQLEERIIALEQAAQTKDKRESGGAF